MNDNLLEYLIKNIASSPAKVKIKEEENENGLNITVNVDKDDIARIIGKNGKVISAVRTIVKTYYLMHGRQVNIQIS